MTWFKVDDNFWSHPKVLLLSLDARGLWVSAGSWCAAHLTDGVVPMGHLKRISPMSPKRTELLAAELEDSGLWFRRGDAWVFHDWQEYQPTREKVEEEREKNRERQRKYAQRKANVVAIRPHKTPKPNGVSNAVTNGAPDPTRPDHIDAAGFSPPAASISECPHGVPNGPPACPLCRLQHAEQQQETS